VQPGMVVQELGYEASDADEQVRSSIVERSGSDLVGEDSDEVVDVVLLWWRGEDGDLVDALVDAIGPLADNGVIWVLTPKTGKAGHVEPSEIAEATRTAGLAQTTTVAGGPQWMIARLARPKSGKVRR